MTDSDDIKQLRNAVQSLQGGLLAALNSLENFMEKTDNQATFEGSISELKHTVKNLQSLQRSDMPGKRNRLINQGKTD